jgi:hypothetical protein
MDCSGTGKAERVYDHSNVASSSSSSSSSSLFLGVANGLSSAFLFEFCSKREY